MRSRLERGEADGILVWSINRLLRNPVDHGTISWMLQQGGITSLQTMEKEYLPGDNVVLLSVESAVANQFILDLRKQTLRGLASKVEKGWFPHRAPLGYLNNIVEKTIEADPLRFPILRRAWEMLLSGGYSVREVRNTLNAEGFRTPRRRSGRGGEMRLCHRPHFTASSPIPFMPGILCITTNSTKACIHRWSRSMSSLVPNRFWVKTGVALRPNICLPSPDFCVAAVAAGQ